MTLTDVLIILATALSPLIAVQVTRWLDDKNEVRGRKLQVFKTLMATRAYSLAPAHVEALNRIDLEFTPKKKSEKQCWMYGNNTLTTLEIKLCKPKHGVISE